MQTPTNPQELKDNNPIKAALEEKPGKQELGRWKNDLQKQRRALLPGEVSMEG